MRPDPYALERLGPRDLVETFAFLDRDPVVNVYPLALLLRDALGRPQDEYWAVRRDGAMRALLYLGGPSGALLPIGDDAPALRRLGDHARERLGALPRRFQVIGGRDAVAPFLEHFVRSGLTPRLDRGQVYMALSPAALAPFERLPELRPAMRDDVELVYASGAELRAEEIEEDPRRTDPAGYARRVDDECRDGHTWLWVDGEGLCFRASISALTADAAQVSGVFTPPGRRRRGYARRGLSELCARLFARSRTVCLFVNDFNHAALAVYTHIGFTERLPWRSLFYDRGP